MHSFQDTRIIPYDADLIYQIVMDIEKYPEFIPWCTDAKILSINDDFLTAELFVEFKGIKDSYVSKVSKAFKNNEYIIKTSAIPGSFKSLNSVWSIKKLDNSSEVKFSIDFEFKSRILGAVIGKVFSAAAGKMVGAFEKQADYISGKL